MSISPRILFTSKGAAAPLINLPARADGIETGDMDLMIHMGVSSTWTANYAFFKAVFVPVKCKINGIIVRVGVASGNIDVGIYNAAGTRLVSSGSVACPAAGYGRIALTETTLDVGWVWLAIAINNATATFYHTGLGGALPSGYQRAAVSQAAAFPLPATMPAVNYGDFGIPWMRVVHS